MTHLYSRPNPLVLTRTVLALCCLLLSQLTAYSQNPPPADETIKISTELVVLDVQVLNKQTGQTLNALRREDFVLYEDGARQEIAHFSQDRLPLSILLLLDLSASVKPIITEIRHGALQTLEHLKPEDEVAVMSFADSTQLLQDFTRDRRLVVKQLGRLLESTPAGVGTALHTSLHSAATEMNRINNPARRRVIIVITDNIASMYKFTNPTVEDVNARLLETGSVVCALLVGSHTPRALNIFTRNHRDIYNRRVRVDEFTEPTGGEVMNADARDVNQKLAQMIDHLRVRYSIGYTPTNTQRDGRFRRINLQLNAEAQRRAGTILVKTRQGYYARTRGSSEVR
jgi:VWFA-related protein